MRDLATAAQILIVDDDPLTLRHYTEILQLEGYRVLTAADAESAFSTAREVRLDAVIVDLHMPSLDGFAILRRLHADRPGPPTPAAIVTGDYLVGEAEMGEARALGARIVFKPLWLEELLVLAKSLVH